MLFVIIMKPVNDVAEPNRILTRSPPSGVVFKNVKINPPTNKTIPVVPAIRTCFGTCFTYPLCKWSSLDIGTLFLTVIKQMLRYLALSFSFFYIHAGSKTHFGTMNIAVLSMWCSRGRFVKILGYLFHTFFTIDTILHLSLNWYRLKPSFNPQPVQLPRLSTRFYLVCI